MSREAVVLVHGLWVNGMDMSLLRHRLRQAGYATHQFSYNSVAQEPAENAEKLQNFVADIDSEELHFVAHSLGGLVVRYLFHHYARQRPGRIVTLGTPHNESYSARQLSRFPLTRVMLGKSINNGLLGEMPAWQAARDLGSIAGTLRLGMGLIVPGLPRPSDGTVAVQETLLEGMSDHLVLNVSHFGLLLSTSASDATAKFLRTGSFQGRRPQQARDSSI